MEALAAPAILEYVADASVTRVGLTFVNRPPLPLVPMIVKQVKEDMWGFEVGIEVGYQLFEINGLAVGDMNDESFRKTLAQRPLHLKFLRPKDEEWIKLGHFQKDNIRLALRVGKLQQALKEEHDRWVKSDTANDDTFQWWTASRARLQDELFHEQGELAQVQGAMEEAVQVSESFYQKKAGRAAEDTQKRIGLQEALEEEHMQELQRTHEQIDKSLEDQIQKAELEKERVRQALVKSEAQAASVSKDSTHAEKQLAEFRQECEELSGDRNNLLKGMQDVNKAKGAIATQEQMTRSLMQRENEDLQAEAQTLEEHIARVKLEASSSKAGMANLEQDTARASEVGEHLRSARADAELLRVQLSRAERKLHFEHCASMASNGDVPRKVASTNGSTKLYEF